MECSYLNIPFPHPEDGNIP